MSAEFLPGDRCVISHDIIIEGRPAFEAGEPVVVQEVRPNSQSPRHKYVVLSQKFQKHFQLQDSDLATQRIDPPEEQPLAPAQAATRPSEARPSAEMPGGAGGCMHQYAPTPEGPLRCRKCGHTLVVKKKAARPAPAAEPAPRPGGARSPRQKPSEVLGKYSVMYLGGLPEFPKKKMSAIEMYLTPESFVFSSSMKWWTDMEIPYGAVTEFQVVKNVVGSVRAVLGGLDSRQLDQDNNIHITYRTPEGERMLRLEMQSGLTVMGAARKCRELNDFIRSHGISEKFYRPAGPEGGDVKACPYCAETIKAAAIKCKHCGSDLQAS